MLGEGKNRLHLHKIDQRPLVHPDCSLVTNQTSNYKEVTATNPMGAGVASLEACPLSSYCCVPLRSLCSWPVLSLGGYHYQIAKGLDGNAGT
jgi:hypothetical protein